MTVEGRVNKKLLTIKQLKDENEALLKDIDKIKNEVVLKQELIEDCYDLISQNNVLINKLEEMPDD